MPAPPRLVRVVVERAPGIDHVLARHEQRTELPSREEGLARGDLARVDQGGVVHAVGVRPLEQGRQPGGLFLVPRDDQRAGVQQRQPMALGPLEVKRVAACDEPRLERAGAVRRIRCAGWRCWPCSRLTAARRRARARGRRARARRARARRRSRRRRHRRRQRRAWQRFCSSDDSGPRVTVRSTVVIDDERIASGRRCLLPRARGQRPRRDGSVSASRSDRRDDPERAPGPYRRAARPTRSRLGRGVGRHARRVARDDPA